MAWDEESRGAREAIMSTLKEFVDLQPEVQRYANIKVVGVGGGGSNAVNRMVQANLRGIELIAVNTDSQALAYNSAPLKLQIGENVTKGRGTGGVPAMGQKAAEESSEILFEVLKGAEMVFITAGMGGGTGTGAAPVIAQIAKENQALTVAVVTKPFTFEGNWRRQIADDGVLELRDKVDTLIVIPNDRVLEVVGEDTMVDDAFSIVDDVLRQGIQGIAELVTHWGFINLDLNDVRTIMNQAGAAHMAIGHGEGPNRAVDAAQAAISSPLLETSINGAKRVLFNITGGSDMRMSEIRKAAEVIHKAADAEAKIIFGTVINPEMKDQIRITVVATGFGDKPSVVFPIETTAPIKLDSLVPPRDNRPDDGRSEIPAFLQGRLRGNLPRR